MFRPQIRPGLTVLGIWLDHVAGAGLRRLTVVLWVKTTGSAETCGPSSFASQLEGCRWCSRRSHASPLDSPASSSAQKGEDLSCTFPWARRKTWRGRRWVVDAGQRHWMPHISFGLGGRARLHPSRPPSRMRQHSTCTRFPSSACLCVVGFELVAGGGNKVRSHHIAANRSLHYSSFSEEMPCIASGLRSRRRLRCQDIILASHAAPATRTGQQELLGIRVRHNRLHTSHCHLTQAVCWPDVHRCRTSHPARLPNAAISAASAKQQPNAIQLCCGDSRSPPHAERTRPPLFPAAAYPMRQVALQIAARHCGDKCRG